MIRLSDPPSIRTNHIISAFVIFTILAWIPAIFIPFWGDDYFFLQQAKEARLNNLPWIMPFYSESATGFWRPLSMDTPWRIIETYLNGNSISAHIFSFLMWLISVLFIYLLSFKISATLHWENAKILSLIAASLYSFSAVHFLVLHWVSAINSSFLVIFICLPLVLWIALINSEIKTPAIYLCMPLLQLLALFCKESAILLPALMLCISIFTRKKLTFPQILTCTACVIIGAIWFYFFKQVTHSRHVSYDMTLGINIIQNSMALAAWILNIPREAIRLILDGQIVNVILWISPILVCMSAFLYFAINGMKKFVSKFQLLSILGFMFFAYAPYFVLSSQSYEYYAAIAIILPTIVIARSLIITNRVYVGLLVFGVASLISIQGSRMLDYPGLIGRAQWAQAEFDWLKSESINTPLVVYVNDEHRFYAMGVKGLAWQLGIPEHQIVLSDKCIRGVSKMLIQKESGDFAWEDCSLHN
jgi:hypothetical protein